MPIRCTLYDKLAKYFGVICVELNPIQRVLIYIQKRCFMLHKSKLSALTDDLFCSFDTLNSISLRINTNISSLLTEKEMGRGHLV